MRVLAGDIGGTNCRLCLYDASGGRLEALSSEVFINRHFASPVEIIRAFLRTQGAAPPEALCLGVAGPVVAGRASLTNLSWVIEEDVLGAALGIARVSLLNDLQAAALGMIHLGESSFVRIKDDGRWGGAWPPPASLAVIAPGTGLGEAMLYWDGQRHHAIATEGGHADFAPRNAEEDGLLGFLRAHHGDHVSYERVLSGPGLVSLYHYLNQSRSGAEPAWLADALGGDNAAMAISKGALERADPVCVRAVEMFTAILGAEAGNLVLKLLAEGGAIIGGGIAPSILPALRGPAFTDGFAGKGRMSALLERLPVRVCLDPGAALTGAAHHAFQALVAH